MTAVVLTVLGHTDPIKSSGAFRDFAAAVAADLRARGLLGAVADEQRCTVTVPLGDGDVPDRVLGAVVRAARENALDYWLDGQFGLAYDIDE